MNTRATGIGGRIREAVQTVLEPLSDKKRQAAVPEARPPSAAWRSLDFRPVMVAEAAELKCGQRAPEQVDLADAQTAGEERST
jgi:hypothetical protein